MIDPKTLIEQVKNTAPFLFSDPALFSGAVPEVKPETKYIQILNQKNPSEEMPEFFELCISAHFATVGTFVPTDVDTAIRQKLWKTVHEPGLFDVLCKAVQKFQTWDESLVSRRWIAVPGNGRLSGHQGEWFTIAMAAYGQALKIGSDRVSEIREAIEFEVKHQEVALVFLREKLMSDQNIENFKNYMHGISSVAHNLGDLDRMFDLWQIGEHDVLKRRVYRLGHEDARKPRPVFLEAGEIYQTFLANENHRHFALREPKGLRKSSQFLLSYGPFFDDWGESLVVEGLSRGIFTDGEFREIIEALISGWKRLNPKSIYTSQGYSRALAGVMNAFPKKREDLSHWVPSPVVQEWNEGGLRTLVAISQSQFEKTLMKNVMKKITSLK